MRKIFFFLMLFSVVAFTACEDVPEDASAETDETSINQNDNDMNRAAIEKYFETHDPQYVAEDAEFIHVGSGEVTRGRQAIGEMLNHIYHVAFDAHAEMTNKIITEDKALLEANFKGKHIGEFAGIPATGKEVNVPLVVSYDHEDGLITKARVYMLTSVMMQQLGVTEAQEKEAI